MKLRNPQNDYVEESSLPFLWCLLFGAFYFMFKGAWAHAVLFVLFALLTAGITWFIYPFFASAIVKKTYLRKGFIPC